MVSKNWKDSFPWDKCAADVREGTVSPLLSQQHLELCLPCGGCSVSTC